jgi:hypothetical protein
VGDVGAVTYRVRLKLDGKPLTRQS